LAYQPRFGAPKIIYPHFANQEMFAFDQSRAFSNDKTYFIPDATYDLLALLNSKLLWWILKGLAPAVRNAWRELRVQYVSQLPIPDMLSASRDRLAALGEAATAAAKTRLEIQSAVRRRILDLAPPERAKLNGKLEDWHELKFSAFRAEIKRAFRVEIPVRERGGWEFYLSENAAKVRALSDAIAAAEREIDAIVYALFDLTPVEIARLEASLEGQY
jgi:hypothetical protein